MNRLISKFIARIFFIRWEEEQFKRRELVQKVCASYRGLGRERVKESPIPPQHHCFCLTISNYYENPCNICQKVMGGRQAKQIEMIPVN